MMRFILWLLECVGIVLSILVSVAAGAALVYVSWHAAPADGSRFRWVMTAKDAIEAGEQITARMIGGELRRLSLPQSEVATESDVLNQYTYRQIAANAVIERSALGPSLWTSQNATALVPVAVDAQFAAGLHPGQRAAFAMTEEKKTVTAGIPTCSAKAAQEAGYLIVAKSEADGDPKKTIVVVAVPEKETATLIKLASGTWRAIGLAKPAPAADFCSKSAVKAGTAR